MFVGAVRPVPALEIDPETIVRRQLSLFGQHNYAPIDLRTAVEFLAHCHQSFPFADLVEREFPLAEATAAMQFAIDRQPTRVAIVPND